MWGLDVGFEIVGGEFMGEGFLVWGVGFEIVGESL